MEKFKSRKFLISVAAFLGSIATSVAGFATDNPKVAAVGAVCGVLSAAIYAGCEAYVDAAAVNTEVTYYMADNEEESEE